MARGARGAGGVRVVGAARGGARSCFEAWRRDGWVRPFVRRYRGVLALAVLLSVAASVFAAALMFASGYMISLAAAIPLTVLALHLPSIFVRIFGIGKPVLQYFERLASHDWVLRMTSSLRRRLYDAVEARPAGFGAGRVLGLFADDLEHLQNLCLRTLLPMLVVSAVYLLAVVAMGALSPLMGLAMLVVVGLAAFAMPFWALAANGARVERRQAIEAGMYDALAEDAFGIVDWGLSGRCAEFVSRHMEPYEAAYAELRARRAFERRLSVLRQALYCVAVVAVFAWAAWVFCGEAGAGADGFVATGAASWLGGVAMHDSSAFAANWIAAFVLCMFPLLDVFSAATDAVVGIAEHRGALVELNALDGDGDCGCGGAGGDGRACAGAAGGCADAAARDGTCGAQAAAVRNEACAAEATGHGGEGAGAACEPCESPGNAIELDAVSFSHDGVRKVLSDVSLAIPRGARVAVVGRSGEGKSTLLDVIRGKAAASSGSVRRTGKVGMVEQFPYVFRKSLRENLLLAKPQASDAELERALERVRLGSLLGRLPDGLDTLMAEGGATLSGGERHRLALARILLFECDIVLLDEPYLGLDPATESEVSATMLEVLAGKTVVVVTHHVEGAEAYDAVLRVEAGRVAAADVGTEAAGTADAGAAANADAVNVDAVAAAPATGDAAVAVADATNADADAGTAGLPAF